jgi:hypothetical protein
MTAAPGLPPDSPRPDGVGLHHVEPDGLFRFAPSVAGSYLADEGVPGVGCFVAFGVGAAGAALREMTRMLGPTPSAWRAASYIGLVRVGYRREPGSVAFGTVGRADRFRVRLGRVAVR